MAISRADLLKELLPGLNELFGIEYKTPEEKRIAALIDQVIANDLKKKEEGFIRQAGETFRNVVKIAQIKVNDLKKAEEGDEHRSISKSS